MHNQGLIEPVEPVREHAINYTCNVNGKFKLGGLERFISSVTGVCAKKNWEAPSPPPDEGVGLGIVEPPSS